MPDQDTGGYKNGLWKGSIESTINNTAKDVMEIKATLGGYMELFRKHCEAQIHAETEVNWRLQNLEEDNRDCKLNKKDVAFSWRQFLVAIATAAIPGFFAAIWVIWNHVSAAAGQ